MANITETMRKNGDVAYVLRFSFNQRRGSISFDSSYSRREVEEAARVVENIILAERKGEYLDRWTRNYIENAPVEIQRKFAKAGFREATNYLTLKDAWKEFASWKYQQVAPSTQTIWNLIGDRLFSLLDEGRQIRTITANEAQVARIELANVYSEATVATTIGRFRTFWTWALAKGYVESNIFQEVKKGSDVNRDRDFQIPREWTGRILDACPSQNWRTLFALWRIGGLRQQEPLQLTWNCVNWEKKRLLVPSPKTSRYEGRESRLIPLFPILERELGRSFEECPEGELYIVWENRRKGFDSGFKRILFWAGLSPWAKLFQNMRSSRENDLIEDGYPPHVVGAWLGHTSKVQERHYLRVLDSYFDRATDEISHNQFPMSRDTKRDTFVC